jgi:hypothetical protein
MTLTVQTLLERGFLPRELPPPFTSAPLAALVSTFTSQRNAFGAQDHKSSKGGLFNLARSGSLRRELSVLNPVHFALLAHRVVRDWNRLEKQAWGSSLSLSRPTANDSQRAIGRENSLDVRPERRAALYATGRYLLKADIHRFYHSIYTHIIPWALQGKAHAKRFRRARTLGNDLDHLVQACQDGQTNGIPVGPDTSLLIAEVVLSKVDAALRKRRMIGLRYIDDYELVFDSEQEALEGLAFLQEALLAFELHLNPAKTRILSLPQPVEDAWVDELRRWHLDPASPRAKTHLTGFFDRVFVLATENATAGVMKWACAKVASVEDWREHTGLVEDLVVQCARVEAGCLPFVLEVLVNSAAPDAERTERRGHLLARTVLEHAPKGHSSEVAWALWAHLVLGFQLPAPAGRAVVRMSDAVCGLLALHARALNLAESPKAFEELQASLTPDALYDRQWLLAYEASVRGWLPSADGADHVGHDPNFRRMKEAGVRFYDVSRVTPESLPRRTRRGPTAIPVPEGTAGTSVAGFWYF